MIDINQLREQTGQLDLSTALVGFLSDSLSQETIVPLSDLVCCCLMRDQKTRNYKAGQKNPAILAVVPAIYDRNDGRVSMGGPDWYYTTVNNRRVYSKKRLFDPRTKEERTRPVGILRDIFEDEPTRNMFLADGRRLNAKLTSFARDLVSATPETVSGFAACGDHSPTVPLFLSPVSTDTRARMRLRTGPALEEQLLHIAETGEWGIPSLRTLSAPDNGFLKGINSNTVELWVPLQGITEDELRAVSTDKSEYRIEPGHQVFTITNPTEQVAAKIKAVFGVNVCPEYTAAVTPGQKIQVRAGRAMFAPLQRRHWTIQELKSRADYEALCYAVALHQTFEHNGVEMLDFSVAYDPSREPWVDLSSVPRIQKIVLAVPTHRPHRHITNLAGNGAGYDFDLLNISLRVELRRPQPDNSALHRKVSEKPQHKANAAAPRPSEIVIATKPVDTTPAKESVVRSYLRKLGQVGLSK